MMNSVKTYFKVHTSTYKRKSEDTTNREDKEMNNENYNTKMVFRRKVETDEKTISSLHERLGKQERALVANSKIMTISMQQNLDKL